MDEAGGRDQRPGEDVSPEQPSPLEEALTEIPKLREAFRASSTKSNISLDRRLRQPPAAATLPGSLELEAEDGV